ncbi:MAG: protein kinase domain-containing protein [Acidobacteriaceae bacterium]
MQETVQIGETLLHYRLVRHLGSGGMGVVYEAEDTRLGRTVAVKLLHANISNDDEARQRFMREARAASAIDHPNLCTIHAIEETPSGALLLVMTLYRGRTLADLLLQGPLEPERITAIGRQIGDGLHAAHMAGIIHRDIKPANIFLLNSGVPKILDFGLSRIAHQSQLTSPHQVMGTLAYMPPEQLCGDHIDHRADIWALGAVLYEMATGHPPFQHVSQAGVMSAIARAQFPPLHELRPDLPAHLHRAVAGALRLHPHERHASVAELLRVFDPGAGLSATQSLSPGGGLQGETSNHPRSQRDSDAATMLMSNTGSASFRATAIAVLPLENLSSDPENEYFSDGLTDELISILGQIPGLRVVSRASVFAFRGKAQNARQIGESLSVPMLVEGSVRRALTRVRVATQLTDVSTGFQMWNGKFDREMKDIFELQDELAGSIVDALRDKLATPLAAPAPAQRVSSAPDAYEAYLKGRYHWNQKTPDGVQLAGRYFQQALEIDPGLAAAHAGLADYYSLLGTLGLMPPHEAWPLARASAQHALALNPDLPEAHLALASVLQFYQWDWAGAEAEILRALELRPQRGESYYTYVSYLMTQGLLEEALEQALKGLRFDPLSTPLLMAEALLRCYLGEHETCILLARQALEATPHYSELYYALGMACHASGRTREAVEAFEHGIEKSGMPLFLGWLAEAHVLDGNAAQAEKALHKLIRRAEEGSPMPIPIAVAAAALAHHDLAFEWLERAAESRDIMLGYVTVLPSLRSLRSDPRYHALIERMGLKHPQTHARST